jgi:hypothetical protein
MHHQVVDGGHGMCACTHIVIYSTGPKFSKNKNEMWKKIKNCDTQNHYNTKILWEFHIRHSNITLNPLDSAGNTNHSQISEMNQQIREAYI